MPDRGFLGVFVYSRAGMETRPYIGNFYVVIKFFCRGAHCASVILRRFGVFMLWKIFIVGNGS